MLLAIDTSTSAASIALVESGMPLAELSWSVGQRHSSELLQRLDWLFTTQGIAPAAIDGIAVASGPGSFNGVRVALATAKSLAFSLRASLYAIPTLDVIAWGCHLAEGPIWALLEAGRGEVYAASYAAPTATVVGWKPRDEYAVLTPAALAERILAETGTALFCGEWRAETRAQLELALGAGARFDSVLTMRRALWLAELALARAASGRYDDPTTAEPLYMRRPAITTSARAKQEQQRREHPRQDGGMPGGEGATRALRG